MADFPNKSKYNELRAELKYPMSEVSVVLKGIRSMLNFFHKEVEFWSSSKSSAVQPINSFLAHFQHCVTVLNTFEQQNHETAESTFNSNWQGVISIIGLTVANNRQLLSSRTPAGQFIFSVMDENSAQGLGAYDFLTKRRSDFVDREHAIGNI